MRGNAVRAVRVLFSQATENSPLISQVLSDSTHNSNATRIVAQRREIVIRRQWISCCSKSIGYQGTSVRTGGHYGKRLTG